MASIIAILLPRWAPFSAFEFHNVGTPLTFPGVLDIRRRVGVNKVRFSPYNCQGKYNGAKDKNGDDLKYVIYDEHETLGTFRTPTLRNVFETSPYMYGGQYQALKDIVKHYVDPPPVKIGESDTRMMAFDLKDKEHEQLELFLRALDSETDVDARWLKPPTNSN